MNWEPAVSYISDLKISSSVPHTDVTASGILFSAVVPEGKEASLLLYEKGSEDVRCEIPFPEKPSMGRISAMLVSGIPAEMVEYNYKIGGRIVTDPAAQIVAGLDRFGDRSARSPHHVRGGFIKTDFDWGNDRDVLRIPYSESVFYELHVRGFTKHRNSKVKAKGCFSGLAEKIPYLKSLGVTAVVLLPIYEFDEITEDDARLGWRPEGLRELIAGTALPQSAVTVRESGQEEQAAADRKQGKLNPKDPASSAGSGKREGKLNYWGFGPGWFFAPKRSYSASDSPEDELRAMVRSFHEAGMEVIMEMSFPEGMDIAFIRSCLLWWRQVYHMDGFYLTGNQDDINSAVKSAALSDVKLISDYFDTKRMYPKGRPYRFRNLAECNVGFRRDVRQILKGDENQLRAFVDRIRYNPKDSAVVNTITSHNGFTLMDLVSYNDKHNEANGEQNHDGAATEYSWNCGVEGPCRKKEISRLRLRQMKNALSILLLSQGTPMLLAGDEMGNSQDGNSNAYCMDSELTWLDWPDNKASRELTDFVKKLIALRKAYPILHTEQELSGGNSGGFFPDFSCHGSNAWFASFDQQDRTIGLMYSVRDESGEDCSCIYAAYNLHWQEQKLALPYLPHEREWHVILNTGEDRFTETEESGQDAETAMVKSITVPGRTVIVLAG